VDHSCQLSTPVMQGSSFASPLSHSPTNLGSACSPSHAHSIASGHQAIPKLPSGQTLQSIAMPAMGVQRSASVSSLMAVFEPQQQLQHIAMLPATAPGLQHSSLLPAPSTASMTFQQPMAPFAASSPPMPLINLPPVERMLTCPDDYEARLIAQLEEAKSYLLDCQRRREAMATQGHLMAGVGLSGPASSSGRSSSMIVHPTSALPARLASRSVSPQPGESGCLNSWASMGHVTTIDQQQQMFSAGQVDAFGTLASTNTAMATPYHFVAGPQLSAATAAAINQQRANHRQPSPLLQMLANTNTAPKPVASHEPYQPHMSIAASVAMAFVSDITPGTCMAPCSAPHMSKPEEVSVIDPVAHAMDVAGAQFESAWCTEHVSQGQQDMNAATTGDNKWDLMLDSDVFAGMEADVTDVLSGSLNCMDGEDDLYRDLGGYGALMDDVKPTIQGCMDGGLTWELCV
jgi:hypothetical protein